MLVRELMTPNPAVCAKETGIRVVAELMVRHDCGAIPVCDEENRVIGIITDRDITCRCIARGLDPDTLNVADCMTRPVAAVEEDASLARCLSVMESNRVRRAVVVDFEGRCVGMVSQADVALKAPLQETGEVVKEVSRAR